MEDVTQLGRVCAGILAVLRPYEPDDVRESMQRDNVVLARLGRTFDKEHDDDARGWIDGEFVFDACGRILDTRDFGILIVLPYHARIILRLSRDLQVVYRGLPTGFDLDSGLRDPLPAVDRARPL